MVIIITSQLFFNKTQMNLIYNKIQKKYLSILNRLTITSKVTSLIFNEYILITVNFLLIPLLVRSTNRWTPVYLFQFLAHYFKSSLF